MAGSWIDSTVVRSVLTPSAMLLDKHEGITHIADTTINSPDESSKTLTPARQQSPMLY